MSSMSTITHSKNMDIKRCNKEDDFSDRNFPTKLFRFLIVAEELDLSDVVSWQPNERCFRVHNPTKFTTITEPNWFVYRKFSSFQRQLNIYGFQRIVKGIDKNSYYHPSFLKGHPELVKNIKRVPLKKYDESRQPTPDSNLLDARPVSNQLSTDSSRHLATIATRQGVNGNHEMDQSGMNSDWTAIHHPNVNLSTNRPDIRNLYLDELMRANGPNTPLDSMYSIRNSSPSIFSNANGVSTSPLIQRMQQLISNQSTMAVGEGRDPLVSSILNSELLNGFTRTAGSPLAMDAASLLLMQSVQNRHLINRSMPVRERNEMFGPSHFTGTSQEGERWNIARNSLSSQATDPYSINLSILNLLNQYEQQQREQNQPLLMSLARSNLPTLSSEHPHRQQLSSEMIQSLLLLSGRNNPFPQHEDPNSNTNDTSVRERKPDAHPP